MKRLARKCEHCQNVMLVDAGEASFIHVRYVEPNRFTRGVLKYNNIDCVQGCYIPKTQGSGIHIVKCSSCQRLKYLSKFEEVKV